MTIVCATKSDSVSATDEIFGIWDNNDPSGYVTFKRVSSPQYELDCDSGNTETLNSNFGGGMTTNTWYVVLISVDMTSTSRRHVYINGSNANPSWGTYNNNNLETGQANVQIGDNQYGPPWEGDLGFLYFSTSYIDFSQESNRNLFVDQLGYPKDLTPAIEAGTIADPLIYMKFDDTSALGTNSGTGGNFTVNGTVTAGADVDPNA
jgi:hypothetical protein